MEGARTEDTAVTEHEQRLFNAALGRTGRCPSPELLAEKASDPDMQHHVQGCAHCRTELAMLQEFENAEPRADELASVQWIESELSRRASPRSVRPRSAWDGIRAWVVEFALPRRRGALSVAFASVLVMVAAGW